MKKFFFYNFWGSLFLHNFPLTVSIFFMRGEAKNEIVEFTLVLRDRGCSGLKVEVVGS